MSWSTQEVITYCTRDEMFFRDCDANDGTAMNRKCLEELRSLANRFRMLHYYGHCASTCSICNLDPLPNETNILLIWNTNNYISRSENKLNTTNYKFISWYLQSFMILALISSTLVRRLARCTWRTLEVAGSILAAIYTPVVPNVASFWGRWTGTNFRCGWKVLGIMSVGSSHSISWSVKL